MSSESQKDLRERKFQGVPAAPGVAIGPAFVFSLPEIEVPEYEVEEKDLERELVRFENALLKTRQQISGIRNEIAKKLGESEAQIFDAHLLVVEDKALIDETLLLQRETKRNIESCFVNVSQRFIDFFDSVDDEYLRERVGDIRDVTRRILSNLLGETDFASSWNKGKNAPRVVVSNMINASDVAGIGKGDALAFVSSLGGRTSHTVIMARSMGIPAVVGIPELTTEIDSGDKVLVDGYDGIFIVNPSESTLFRYGELVAKRRNIQEIYVSQVAAPTDTKDGFHVRVSANVEGPEDLEAIWSSDAEGIGLYRTEALFLRGKGMQSEEAQFTAYAEVVKGMKGRRVVIRTIDLGGDKMVAPIGLSGLSEENPFMGFRAIRFCLRNPLVLSTQFRAILRASAFGEVAILYPMVSGAGEIREANEILEQTKVKLREERIDFDEGIRVGTMVEIPSAALTIDVLAKECSFLSIGTNDLVQYLLAVDRINEKVAHLYDPSHPAVIRCLGMILRLANSNGLEVAVCGEMGGDPLYVPLLIGLGVDELSMTAALIPEAKFLIRSLSKQECQALATEVLEMKEPEMISERLQRFYREAMEGLLTKN